MDILADVVPAGVLPEPAARNNGNGMVSAAEADPMLQSAIAAENTPTAALLADADFSGNELAPVSQAQLDEQFKQPNWTTPDLSKLLFKQPDNIGQLEREQFRTLRSRLYQIRVNQPIKTVLISSALPEEGKTFVSANLAMVMALKGGSAILLIDADLRKPGLHQLLGAPSSPGLAEYLSGKADEASVIQRSPISNLCFVPGGKSVSNPAELIGNGRLAKLVENVGSIFDWIIVDSPPAVPIADASLIAEACDGVVLVINASSTGFDVAKKACTEFRQKPVLGAVLNRADSSTSYGAYYYHHYGKTTPPDSSKS